MTKGKQKWTWYKRGSWWRKIRMNRKYRDRLFRFLFQDKKNLLDLYNALTGSSYNDPEELQIVTLEDAIFLKMKNDLSFVIGNQLNLYEHQSTYNPNMPLRGLFYFAQQYEGLIAAEEEDLYGDKLILLPTPQYIIFYNGSDALEDSRELYLSDSFSEGRGSGCLECRCTMLNINKGHNEAILKKCHRLWEYSEFISEIQTRLNQGYALQDAVQAAINHCIDRGILKDVLLRQKTEVLHMLLTEYNEKKHLQHQRDYWRKIGQDEGRKEGRKEGIQAEKENTLREKIRADNAETRAAAAEAQAEESKKQANAAEEHARQLTAELEQYKKKYGAMP